MDMDRDRLLNEVMAADFTVIDLSLYLNTHPYDQKALGIYNNYVQKAKMLRDNYEKLFGPITVFSYARKSPWQWIESPWPWEG